MMPKQCPIEASCGRTGLEHASAALVHAFTRRQQGWRTLATHRRTDAAEHGPPVGGLHRCTPRFAVTVRGPLLILEKAAAFEHQVKTIDKLTDG